MSELEIRPETREPMSMAADVARDVARMMLDDLKRPSFRAGFGAALLTTAALSRTRAPFLMIVLTSVMVGGAVERFYVMAEDIHARLGKEPFQLLFHGGNGCPGHEPGTPGATGKDCPDATGKI